MHLLRFGENAGKQGTVRSLAKPERQIVIRRYGDPKQSETRYRLRAGVYAILWDGRDMLTTFQAAPYPEIQLPGGGIDPGENPIPALHREVLEETGYAISAPRRLGAFRRFTFMPEYELWAEKLCHIYLARPVLRRTTLLEDGHTAVWMQPRQAVKMLYNEGDRGFVEAVFKL